MGPSRLTKDQLLTKDEAADPANIAKLPVLLRKP
jgi:hypothetical protein